MKSKYEPKIERISALLCGTVQYVKWDLKGWILIDADSGSPRYKVL